MHILPSTPVTVLCLYTSWRLKLLHVNTTPHLKCSARLENLKRIFFKIIRKGQGKKHLTPDAVHDAATLQELQKLKSEFVREFSGFLSYLGHRGPCYDDTYPAEKKRNDPKAGVIRLFFPEQEKAYHHLFTEFQFFDEATVGMSWFNRY